MVLKDTDYRKHHVSSAVHAGKYAQRGISPFQIDFAMIRNDYALCEELYASECIACGKLYFVCPAREGTGFQDYIGKKYSPAEYGKGARRID